MNLDGVAVLAARWRRLFRVPADQAFVALVCHYSEPSRHYHTLEHVAAVLETVDLLEPEPPQALLLAVWFHDVVYETHASDNEERSAEYARRTLAELQVDGAVREETARLILLTKTHTAALDDRAGQVLLDADLAILGAEPAVYDDYAAAIRREYDWVDDLSYGRGRTQVLEKFLARPRLYFSPLMAEAEIRARANLEREIAALSLDQMDGR